MTETAIIVALPEAAAAVDEIRIVHTTGGADGIPAHVTLLFPFMEAERVTPAVVEDAERAIAGFAPFAVSFGELRRFDGPPAVLYLAPVPAEPFSLLTAALVSAFPAYPPYGGAHAEVVPHLTVAEGEARELDAFEQAVAPRLPIAAHVAAAGLYRRDAAGRWQPFARLPLEGRG